MRQTSLDAARRIALASVVVAVLLAGSQILIGWLARSTAVWAAGLESAGDALTSALVLLGLLAAAKPSDADHPYGHGRLETVTGLVVGLILVGAGLGICVKSLQRVTELHPPPETYAVWPLIGLIVTKSLLGAIKFRQGRRIGSAALVADAWNDSVDILSGLAALAALGLTLYDPRRFLAADHYGGFAVGLIVIFTGLSVARETSLQLMDTMPPDQLMHEIRRIACSVPGANAVEKCYARKTGLQYHVDLHLEVDPKMTVHDSHEIATQVRFRLREELNWVADVLVHVEPSPRTNEPQAGASR